MCVLSSSDTTTTTTTTSTVPTGVRFPVKFSLLIKGNHTHEAQEALRRAIAGQLGMPVESLLTKGVGKSRLQGGEFDVKGDDAKFGKGARPHGKGWKKTNR